MWLIYFGKIQEPDPIMKEKILFEVDDWFTYLVNKEYKPIKRKGEDLNTFMEANKKQWYKSAIPLITICDRLFEYVKNDELTIHSDDIATWCSTELHKKGYWVPNRNTLKKEITNILGDMGIYTRRIENRMWYYNIKVKDIATEVKQIIQEKSEYEQKRMG